MAPKKRVFLITGAPTSGKTTFVSKTVAALKAQGIAVGGMISQEARDCCTRKGFEVIDVATGKNGWLAHVDQKTGPQVGRYHVNLSDLERIGVRAIESATESCDVVVVDEVGPMELFSAKFKHAVQAALGSDKVVLAVVHAKAKSDMVEELKQSPDAELFTVTVGNRDGLSDLLAKKILSVSRD